MKYRAEIDGLRSVAVIPVILFHAGFELFSGGFVGVDVFFVISGYLITTILVEDLENNRFSIINFYERRARRILPALFFVMLCCIPFAWIWMLPSQMKEFSNSLVAVSFFVSNILFWRESGYFETAAEEKPLLHTWSLAVEEQYYVFFPLFLFLVWRFGKNRVFWLIVLFAALSLTLSEWGWRNKATANFYLAPTRAWELFCGSIAAFVIQKRGVQANNWFSLIGLAAIIFAIFAYDESTPFPSVYTLVPVLGVVLLVLYAGEATFAAKILSSKILVYVGLISYSAYLWHQPLFAFARLRFLGAPDVSLMLLLSIVAIILAYLSWRFVERPFRNKQRFSRKQIFIFSLVAMLLPTTIGVLGLVNNGFASLVPTVTAPSLQNKIWVLGDSHGEHLIEGLSQITSQKVRDLTSPGCIPFRNVDRYDFRFEKGACAKKMNAYLDEVEKLDPDAIVILSSMGPVYLDGTAFKGKAEKRVKGLGVELVTDPNIKDRWRVYELGMRNTLKELSELKNAKIVFAIDVPELGIDLGCGDVEKVISTPWFDISDFVDEIYSGLKAECYVNRSDYDKRATRYKALVYDIVKDFPKIKLFDPTTVFCNKVRCDGYRADYGFLYRDIDHLSAAGSILYAKEFSSWLSHNR